MTGASNAEHERHNRAFWDADADDYQAAHAEQLRRGKVWGVWSIPEAQLGVLGNVRGLDVLEYGCGAADWAIALQGDGARVVALDQSRAQLRHASTNASAAGAAVALVCASGETVPFRDRSFDLIFCDHGVMTFCEPERTVPEIARLLRPGGRCAFSHTTQLALLTDAGKGPTKKLHREWSEVRNITWPEGTSEFQRSPGEWIRLFGAHDLEVEDLIELLAPEGAATTYDEFASYEWARRWPAEQIWKLRRR